MLLSPQFSATASHHHFQVSNSQKRAKARVFTKFLQKYRRLFQISVSESREAHREPQSKSKNLKKMEGGGEGVEMVVDSKDLQQQSKAFDKLTDRVEDRQLNSTRVQEAMASIAASSEADRNAMRLREKELAAVKINAGDVDIIANELELDKKVAERTLREHKGDAVAAIRHLLR